VLITRIRLKASVDDMTHSSVDDRYSCSNDIPRTIL